MARVVAMATSIGYRVVCFTASGLIACCRCGFGLAVLPHAAIIDPLFDTLMISANLHHGWLDRHRVAISRAWTCISILMTALQHTRHTAGVCVCMHAVRTSGFPDTTCLSQLDALPTVDLVFIFWSLLYAYTQVGFTIVARCAVLAGTHPFTAVSTLGFVVVWARR
jgi:hypothetical protein